jgi:hypothetical protein
MYIIDCVTWITHQQVWECKVEEKLYLGVLEQKRLNTTGLENVGPSTSHNLMGLHGLLQE